MDEERSWEVRNRLTVWIPWLSIFVLVGVLLIPAVGSAGVSRFADVSDSSPFLNDIEWLADTGVTRGCNPPANDMFCPSDYVTRQQMAAFLHRQAKYFDADDSGVVDNADAVGGYAPWDLNAAYALYDEGMWYGFEELGWTVALELEIVPPGDGMVHMTGIIDYMAPDASLVNLSTLLCTNVRCGPDVWGPLASDNNAQIVTSAVLPVDPEGDTLRLWMRAPNLGPVSVGQRTLTALFVPFGFTVHCDSDGVCETIEPGG